MNKELLKIINGFKKDRQLLLLNEEATKQTVIMRILYYLGWDPFNINEVYPEYSIRNKRVDYALRHNGKNKVFIEVKKVDEDLEKHQEQLLNYSFQEGVKLAILTNGVSWWFYLPLYEGSWEQRKFYTIEIYDQNSEDIVDRFEDFLSKENVISDKSIKKAESLYKSKQKQVLIKETLPKAWERILTEPDELLVEILSETTEKLCGYKPENEIVEQFLAKISQEKSRKKASVSTAISETNLNLSLEGYTGKTIVAFTFKGNRYVVSSWKEMLIKITGLMFSSHREQFERVLNLKGRKRPYFTKNPGELRNPEKINNTNIYIETNLSANSIVKISKNIIILFGYKENELSIEVI